MTDKKSVDGSPDLPAPIEDWLFDELTEEELDELIRQSGRDPSRVAKESREKAFAILGISPRPASKLRVVHSSPAAKEGKVDAPPSAQRNPHQSALPDRAASPGAQSGGVDARGTKPRKSARRDPVFSAAAASNEKATGTEWSERFEVEGCEYVATTGKTREILIRALNRDFDPQWKTLQINGDRATLCDDGDPRVRRCHQFGRSRFEQAFARGRDISFSN